MNEPWQQPQENQQPPEPTGEEQSASTFSTNNKLLIGIIVILGVLLVGIAGAYLWYSQLPPPAADYSSTPFPKLATDNGESSSSDTPAPVSDETAGWNTYRNEEYGFEFKYPNDWRISTEPSPYRGLRVNIAKPDSKWAEFWMDISCFSGNSNPLTGIDFQSSEPLLIDGMDTTMYRDQSRGLETLRYHIPLAREDVAMFGNVYECGMHIQSWADLTEPSFSIIKSLHFVDGFEAFVNKVIQTYRPKG